MTDKENYSWLEVIALRREYIKIREELKEDLAYSRIIELEKKLETLKASLDSLLLEYISDLIKENNYAK